MNQPLSCDALSRQLPAYLAGTLSSREAEVLETHASTCVICEALLEAATQREVTYAPVVPADVREATLKAIRERTAANQTVDARVEHVPSVKRSARGIASERWYGGYAALAAAALFVVFVANRNLAVDVTNTTPRVDNEVGMVQSAASLAESQARPEFAKLDAAARELEEALLSAPTDRELRAFLSTVRARRDELSRRVKEATS